MKTHLFLFACSFFFSLGGNILNFSLIFRLADWFAFNPGQIGRFIALGQISFFLGCNLYYRLGTAFNPARVFSIAAVVAFMASVPIGYARVQGIIYVAYWVLHLSTGFFWPPLMAWLTEGLGGQELNRKISIFNRSWMAANILGPLFAGGLYQWNSGANFLVIGLSYLTVVLLLLMLRRYRQRYHLDGAADVAADGAADVAADGAAVLSAPPGPQPAGNEEQPPLTPTSQALDKKLDIYRYRGWISNFCGSIFVGVLVNIFPLHIRDGLGYSEASAGTLLFLRCLAGFIGFAVLARFSTWHFNRRWFIILQGALMLCALLFLSAGSRLSLFFAIVMLYGLVHSACYTNSIFYSGATGRSPKKNMALHEIFISISMAAGSAGGGFVYQHFRFAGTCIILFLVLSLGLGLLLLLDRREFSLLSSQDGA